MIEDLDNELCRLQQALADGEQVSSAYADDLLKAMFDMNYQIELARIAASRQGLDYGVMEHIAEREAETTFPYSTFKDRLDRIKDRLSAKASPQHPQKE